ncbi:hypothetical protein D1BOALGB6SA_4403 [Olavius sp. associated proteobacterium Delta 1]|nr:hypothetical protein D1BOALGB6SA_4403 [Olavius sp. associated proteobacterium Delta 1]
MAKAYLFFKTRCKYFESVILLFWHVSQKKQRDIVKKKYCIIFRGSTFNPFLFEAVRFRLGAMAGLKTVSI